MGKRRTDIDHKIYNEEYHPQRAKMLARLGLSHAEMAEVFGIAQRQFTVWLTRYPELREALREGGVLADARVANALFHRAIGYKHRAVKIVVVSQGAGMPSVIEEVEYTQYYPPDTAAASRWLSSRQKELWAKDTSGDDGDGTINVVNSPDAGE